jgi:hypothetical protein
VDRSHARVTSKLFGEARQMRSRERELGLG